MNHKLFLSYCKEDEAYAKRFIKNYSGIVHCPSVSSTDLFEHPDQIKQLEQQRINFLGDTCATVMLIGRHTWQKKARDWDLAISLQHSKAQRPNAVIGLILPTHPSFSGNQPKSSWNRFQIPARLVSNVFEGYAILEEWPEHFPRFYGWLNEALKQRNLPDDVQIDNKRPLLNKDYPRSQKEWRR